MTLKRSIVRMSVNGKPVQVLCDPQTSLLEVLRDSLQLTGTKEGCRSGDCGACTVNVDGKAVCSCLMLAVQADGKKVVTVEGLASGNVLHPLQKAFIRNGIAQCGFCTPGMLMSAKALLNEKIEPSAEEIREAIAGNLCRCASYDVIMKSIQEAAAEVARK
jgi:carbon-monoxide dehydrogenase small subunit